MKRLFDLLVVLIVLGLQDPVATTGVSATHPVDVSVRPSVALAPATVWVNAFVFPSTDNRALEVSVMSSEDEGRLSLEPLDEDSAIQHLFEYKDLGAGDYHVRACVTRVTGADVCAVARLVITE